jgi:predicted Ser/Thr protein kinase
MVSGPSPPSETPTFATQASVGSLGPGVPLAGPIELEPGVMVGDCFRVEHRLGAGAMGLVYLARHTKLDRPVALKVHRAGGPEQMRRLEREARAMARLNHPNVIHVHDVGAWGDGIFVAMEYVDGGTLRTWLQQGRPWREALAMVLQAGQGLAAAHAGGLVHRDFKPENILIGRDGRVRVADFGLAHALPTTEERIATGVAAWPSVSPDVVATTMSMGGSLEGTLSQTGGMAGTPAYMAPEQFGAGRVDARADVFAFCVVAWEALYGRRPFDGVTPAELLFGASTAKITPPPPSEVPEEIEQVLRRGLAADAEHRPANLPALLADLRRAAQRAGRVGPAGVAVAIVVGALLVASALAYGYFALRSPKADSAPVEVVAQRDEALEEDIDAQGLDFAVAEQTGADMAEPDAGESDTGEQGAEPDALLTEAQLAALMGAIVAPEEIDQGALIGAFLPEEDLGDLYGILGALVEKEVQATRAPPGPVTLPEQMDLVAWDGRSPLVCMNGERMRIRGKAVKVEEGIALTAMNGCLLHVLDCTVEAATLLQAVHARVVLENVRIISSQDAIRVLGGQIEIRNLTVEAPIDRVLSVTQGSAFVSDSELRGEQVVDVTNRGQVQIENSRIEATGVAISAANNAWVGLHDTSYEGRIFRANGGAVVELE